MGSVNLELRIPEPAVTEAKRIVAEEPPGMQRDIAKGLVDALSVIQELCDRLGSPGTTIIR